MTAYRTPENSQLLDQLNATEQLCLVAVVRAVIRADGELSEGERDTLAELMPELGEETFHARLEQVEQMPEGELFRLVATVTNPETRALIYDIAVVMAQPGTITEEEQKLLDEISRRWDIAQR